MWMRGINSTLAKPKRWEPHLRKLSSSSPDFISGQGRGGLLVVLDLHLADEMSSNNFVLVCHNSEQILVEHEWRGWVGNIKSDKLSWAYTDHTHTHTHWNRHTNPSLTPADCLESCSAHRNTFVCEFIDPGVGSSRGCTFAWLISIYECLRAIINCWLKCIHHINSSRTAHKRSTQPTRYIYVSLVILCN